MKNLKSLFVIFLTISIFSCSSDDNDNSNLDSVVGVWKPIKKVETYADNSADEVLFSTCQQMTRYTFFNDGALNIEEYAINEISGDCVLRTEPVLTSGSWQKNEDGQYRLITTYTYTANQNSYTDDNIPDIFEFSNNNNTLKIGYLDNEVIDGNQLLNHYTEFVRVE